MRTIRRVVALLAAILPAAAMAQAPQSNTAYLSAEIGNGKVGLRCPADVYCSRVDSSGVLRAGYRLDPSWAVELSYKHVEADWGIWGYEYSAEVTGVGLGAAYTAPLSTYVSAVARLGITANKLELQPAVDVLSKNPGTLPTRSVKPYVGASLSWQFARRWSTSLNADWTRADLREVASGPKQTVTVRTLGAGIAFHF